MIIAGFDITPSPMAWAVLITHSTYIIEGQVRQSIASWQGVTLGISDERYPRRDIRRISKARNVKRTVATLKRSARKMWPVSDG